MSDNKQIKNKKHWKSVKEYLDDPSVLKAKANEFNDGVTDDFDPSQMSAMSRRKFITLLTASAAFTATSCSDYRDKGELVPYTNRPENVQPGEANFYASTCTACSQACGILVKTREGRPVKVDGNPDHPVSKGKICTTGQASILNLYDPERVTDPIWNNRKSNWKEVDNKIIELLGGYAEEGKEIAIITNKIESPTTRKLLEDFRKEYLYVNVNFYSYQVISDEVKRSAWAKCYGDADIPTVKWEDANVVVALDSDFFGREGNTIENIRRFTSGRDVMESSDFNRLYAVESGMSLTGMNADKRIRLRPDAQFDFVMSLLSELILNKNFKRVEYTIRQKLGDYSLDKFAEEYNVSRKSIDILLADVLDNPNKAIFYAGESLPEEVHIAVNFLNEVIDSVDLYDYENPLPNENFLSGKEEWEQLINAINRDNVGAVIAFDSNPIYDLPENIDFKEAVEKVDTVISLTENHNETTSVCNFILPINNPLESWGDHRPRKGVHSLQQPVISPLFNTREKEAIFLTWMNGSPESYSFDIYHKYLMNSFKENVYEEVNPAVGFKKYWYSALHDGVVKIDEKINKRSFNNSAVKQLKKQEAPKGFAIKFERNYFLGAGKYANNGWLQEIPHPVSKITWDNYAAVSPKTAKELNLNNGDFVNIDINNRKIKIPAFQQPGMADEVLTLELGYGRKSAGTVANGVGFDVIPLMSKNYRLSPWLYNNAKVEKAGGNHELVSTQNHHQIDDASYEDKHLERDIIQEGTVEEYKQDPHFLEEKHDMELFNIANPPIEYEGVKWGMSIDLNKCIGCSACVAACNVENNIPVVGKDQVAVGREMQWMRIDRYYSGSPEDPVVSNQPMLCQHCDNAPCENVCPVSATNHSPDGLNQMVYNRCVGTRYCSNNCPFKVRRFNFFNFRDHFAQGYYENNVTPLAHNPEVTVRSRGVMEKCTFCVQRISEERSNAIKEDRPIKGSNVKTACQEACPADAIVFGDVNDKNSEVTKYRQHELGCHVLRETNVRPNVTYIAKLRNTHSEEI